MRQISIFRFTALSARLVLCSLMIFSSVQGTYGAEQDNPQSPPAPASSNQPSTPYGDMKTHESASAAPSPAPAAAPEPAPAASTPAPPAASQSGAGATRSVEVVKEMAGHIDWIKALDFAPDAKNAVSGSADKTARVWNLASGKELFTLAGHSGNVGAVTYTPDGKYIFTGCSGDFVVRQWDAHGGKLVHQLGGHKNSVTAVAASPDGKIVASGDFDGVLKLWNVESGDCIKSVSLAKSAINALAISSNGMLLAGLKDHSVRLVETESLKQVATLAGHTDNVLTIGVSPDGKHAISGGADTNCIVWDLERHASLFTLSGHTDWVLRASYTADGKQILTGSLDKTAKRWDAASGALACSYTGLTSAWSFAFSPDGSQALSGDDQKNVVLYRLP